MESTHDRTPPPPRPKVADEELFVKGFKSLPRVLSLMQFPSLRKGQDQVVGNIMYGRDTLGVLPTSLGKTGCFVIPSLCLDWGCLVFSPLTALMRDQAQALMRKGIPAAAISGIQSAGENSNGLRAWANGEVNFLFVAPERLKNVEFKLAIAQRKPDLVVIDEAHVLSSWSDNFRPDYAVIGDFIAENNPRVVAAFTATCPDEVEEDVRRTLGLPQARKILYYPRRENLIMKSRDIDSDYDLAEMIQDSEGSSIIYCVSRKGVEELAQSLSSIIKDDDIGIFHSKISDADKRHNMDAFMSGKIRIMCATTAFGMGVDKPDVRNVVARDLAGSIEELTQFLGRAGRDGKDSFCWTCRTPRSVSSQKFLIKCSHPDLDDVRIVFNTIKKRADKHGIVHLGRGDICDLAGVDFWSKDAIFSILLSSKCIETVKASDKVASVKFIGSIADDRFTKYKLAIKEAGIVKADHSVEFDMKHLVECLDLVTDTTVKKYLTQWHKEGVIEYTAPPRTNPLRILNTNIEACVEFDRLEEKARAAENKLEEVLDFFHLPDGKKHDYLSDYFSSKI